ncbi:hypothetical protein E1N66_20095, partial [Pantoea allii]
ILYLMLIFLAPKSAKAADIYSMQPNSYIKQNVFDKLFVMSAENPFSSMMFILGMGLMQVASVLVAYTMIAGTAATAHDGEMLGKKWNTMWLYPRIVLGYVAMMPVSGGFSIGQTIVIWCLSQGVGLSENLWAAYAKNMLTTPTYISAHNDLLVRTAAQRMLINAGCVELYNRAQKINSGQDKYSGSGNTWQSAVSMSYTANNGKIIGWNYGIVDDGGFFNSTSKQRMCGNIFIDTSATEDAVADSILSGSTSNLINTKAIFDAVQPKQIEATKKMQQEINAYAKELIASQSYPELKIDSSAVNQKLESFVKSYQASVHAASQNAYAGAINQNAIQNTIDKGFAYIGTYWLQYTKAMASINSIENNVAINGTIPLVATMPQSTGDNSLLISQSAYAQGTGNIEVGKQINTFALMVKDTDQYNEYASSADSNDNFFEKIFAFGSKVLFNSDMTSVDPQTMLTHLGMEFENIGVTGGVVVATTNLAAAVPFAGQAVVATAALFGSMFSGIIMAFITCGAWLHVYLPMMPYLAWLSVYGSIIMLGIEAMCCVQVWLVTHIAPDADDFVGKQGQGYMMIFNLYLTPSFNVIGLISSHIVSNAVYALLNDTFYIAAAGVPGGGIHGTISNVALMIIYVAAATSITQTSIKMITEIPRIAMQWIGGQGGAIMQNMFNAEMEKSNASSMAAAGALTGVMSGLTRSPMDFSKNARNGNSNNHQPYNVSDNLNAEKSSNENSTNKNSGQSNESDKGKSDKGDKENKKDNGKKLGDL